VTVLNVLITIDTEVYPLFSDWRSDNLQRDIRRDINGETSKGDFGLEYQLDVFAKLGLKAVFFVESLFANAVGLTPLQEIVQRILEGGHEVQLHLHPEWLAWMAEPPVRPNGRELIANFTRDEQVQLIGLGRRNLEAAGAKGISAFRSGDYSADLNTLDALAENGFLYDTSYNPCYTHSYREDPTLQSINQPTVLRNICEVPIGCWRTWPLGFRHAQITAASLAELKAALWHAEREGWYTFVIVSHSFELLKRRRHRVSNPIPDESAVKRFLGLCHFLHENNDRFRTCGFSDLDLDRVTSATQKTFLSSPLPRTISRVLQQLSRRF
jgi:hypothetical protein